VETFRAGGFFEIQDNESDMVGGGCTAWEEFLDMTRDEDTEGASAILEWSDEAFEVPSGGVLVTPAAGPDAKEEVMIPVPKGAPVPTSVEDAKVPALLGFMPACS
jgi:hypothetical protein